MVSYYYKPYKGVGALRPTYWAEHIHELDPSITIDVVTAQEQIADRVLPGGGKVITVKDNKRSKFSKFIRFDPGLNWSLALQEFVVNLTIKYDTVVFTGGPFLHFSLAKVFKERFGSRIVLDFRDPFANSPNMKMSYYKRLVKNYLERRYTNVADVIITVNDVCAELLNIGNREKISIIDNGFDESILEKVLKNVDEPEKDKNLHKIIYPGKFYKGAPPNNLFEALLSPKLENKVIFEYIGDNSADVPVNDNIFSNGSMPYEKVLKKIYGSDTGVILTGGEPFESTTKIFDYIALEKNILIITNGKVRTGIIHEITKNYPNVFWSENKVQNIIEVIEKIRDLSHLGGFFNRMEYSRKEGLKKLIKVIKK